MAAKVAAIQELLLLIVEQITNHMTLYNACLVSHAFNVASTPQLYKHLRWHDKNYTILIDRERRCLLLQQRGIKYVRKVTLAITKWQGAREQRARTRGSSRICAAMADIIHQCWRIREVVCEGISPSSEFWRRLTVLPCLESVSVAFPRGRKTQRPYLHLLEGPFELIESDPEAWKHVAFAKLRRLSLLNISDPRVLKYFVLRTMLQSPELEHLALSMARDDIQASGDHKDLFNWLAGQYMRYKGHQLRVKSLQLGFNVVAGTCVPRMLKCVDLNVLEKLSFYRSDDWYEFEANGENGSLVLSCASS
ncbi:hypothetical protein F4808DRAFT_454686 [Astrocystis sublimbata]|nr:hypothetical protein F4808DRAFT_454686 [Astrocystis sublimbata]